MELSSLLPRAKSKFVAAFVIAASSHFVSRILAAALHPLHRGSSFEAPAAAHDALSKVLELLLFAPVIETLELVALIELFRWLRFPALLGIVIPALVACALHLLWWRALLVAPLFFLSAFVYVHWRALSSWRVASLYVMVIHAMFNSPWAVYAAVHTLKTPNHAMQRTAGRSAFLLSMTSTFNPQQPAPSPAVADLESR